MLASSVFPRREGRFLSISPAGVSAILSLKSYLRPWRKLFKGKHKCIKKLSWGLFIADFAKYVNLYSTHFQMTWKTFIILPIGMNKQKFISLIFQSKEVHIDKVMKKHWLLWSIISTKSGSQFPAVDWSLESLVQRIAVAITARSGLWELQPLQQGFQPKPSVFIQGSSN